MTPDGKTYSDLGLSEKAYLRDRLHPAPGSEHYLHAKDLLEAMRQLTPLDPGKVLDYGCGGSPYRSLFATKTYHRADLQGSPAVDFHFGEDSLLPVSDNTYDLVLSSQVLEHVPSTGTYLAESRRVLREGGRLLLSTHGTFVDHGCPHDYHRWTLEGLRHALQQQGFEVEQAWKLTNGARALFYFMRTMQSTLLARDWSLSGLLLRALRIPFRHFPAFIDRACDRHFAPQSIQKSDFGNGELYVGLIVLARKTASPGTKPASQTEMPR